MPTRDSRGRFVRPTPTFTDVPAADVSDFNGLNAQGRRQLSISLRVASIRAAGEAGDIHPLAHVVLLNAEILLADVRRSLRRGNWVEASREQADSHIQFFGTAGGAALSVFRNIGMPHGWFFESWDSYGEYLAIPRAHLAPERWLDPRLFVYSTGRNCGRNTRFANHINIHINNHNQYETEQIVMPTPSYIHDEASGESRFTCPSCDRTDIAGSECATPDSWPTEYICQLCFDQQYTYCEMCDTNVPRHAMTRFDGEPMCDSCADYQADNRHGDPEDASGYVNGYSYRPNPLFTSWDDGATVQELVSGGGFFMGFELEMEMHQARLDDMARIAVSANPSAVYLKSDGSIDYGFELVTHPHTLEAYKQGFNWSWMDELRGAGVRAWNDDNCGLHIHISNDAWSSSGHFARWWVFMRSNSKQWIKLAGRRSTYARWDSSSDGTAYNSEVAARSYKVKPADLTKSLPPAPKYDGSMSAAQIDRMEYERDFFMRYHPNKLAKKASANYERYSALNCQNQNTVELRFWRPSMRHTTVLAALEASHASVEFTRHNKYKGSANGALAWSEFVRWLSEREADYPYANARIAVRFGVVPDRDADA